MQAHDNGGVAGGGVDTSAPQSFTISIAAVDDTPVASDDSFTTTEDTALSIALPGVLANDSDIEGSALTAMLVDGPSHGSLTLNADGSFQV